MSFLNDVVISLVSAFGGLFGRGVGGGGVLGCRCATLKCEISPQMRMRWAKGWLSHLTKYYS